MTVESNIVSATLSLEMRELQAHVSTLLANELTNITKEADRLIEDLIKPKNINLLIADETKRCVHRIVADTISKHFRYGSPSHTAVAEITEKIMEGNMVVELDKNVLKTVMKNIIDMVDSMAYEISWTALDNVIDTQAIRDKGVCIAKDVDTL